MYLLYLDESGTHGGSPVYIISGLAIHEHDMYHLQQRLESTLQGRLPAGHAAIDFELHGSEIKSGGTPRRPSNWGQFKYGMRLSVLNASYRSLSSYEPVDTNYPVRLFGAVVDRNYGDFEKRAYEEVLHRFDEMLGRGAHEDGGSHERGVVVHDESSVESNLQAWTSRWREIAERIPGRLDHIVDVPFFADSKASRAIQAADLVTFALWRYYGLPSPDSKWIDYLWGRFDSADDQMHGLVHVTKDFKSGSCGCRPCQSRSSATKTSFTSS